MTDLPVSTLYSELHIHRCCHCDSLNKIVYTDDYDGIKCWKCGKESLCEGIDDTWLEVCQGDLPEQSGDPFDGLMIEKGERHEGA